MADYDDDEFQSEAQQNAQVMRMNAFRDQHKGKDLKALVLAMKAARARKDALEADLKNANAEHDVLRFELIPDKMEEAGIASGIRFEGIGQVVLLADLRVECTAVTKPGFYAWCKGQKLLDLWKVDINSSTLKSFLKARIKAGTELPPGDLVKVEAVTKASIRK